MQRLSGPDAAFLYLETPEAPMHLGSLYLFDAGTAPRPVGWADLRRHVAARLPLWSRLRQRVVEVPLQLDYPLWLNDPDFYLDHHLPRHVLPSPGGPAELAELAGRLLAVPLDRRRPLWEMHFIEGLADMAGFAPGSFALLTRFHQAMTSAVPGRDALWRLTDRGPLADDPPVRATHPWRPEPLPTDAQLLALSCPGALDAPRDLGSIIGRGAMTGAQIVAEGTITGLKAPPLLFQPPPTPWNRGITPGRSFAFADLEWRRMQSLRRRLGIEANDLVLAVCAGALRQYLDARGWLPAAPLVALSPVLAATEAGVEARPLLVALATDEPEPLLRVQRIRSVTARSGIYGAGLPYEALCRYLPFSMAAMATRSALGLHLADRHRPIFNLVVSYLPGPRWDRYVAGARLAAQLSMTPLFDGLGLSLTAVSCMDRLTVSVLACRELIGDAGPLARALPAALDELEQAAGRKRRGTGKARPLAG